MDEPSKIKPCRITGLYFESFKGDEDEMAANQGPSMTDK
jgi:hypothetical protein